MTDNSLYIIKSCIDDLQTLTNFIKENNIIIKHKIFKSDDHEIVISCNEYFINTLDKTYNVTIYKYSDLKAKL